MRDISNKLGICIPTYNRAKYLERCLNSFIDNFSERGFSVYISDNASTDHTEALIRTLYQKYNIIVYNRNSQNIGAYNNILRVIKMANTEYVWLMGDDDAIIKNGIEKVVAVLQNGFDYIVLNSVPYDITLENKRAEKTIECTEEIKYTKGESHRLLINLRKWYYHGFMSSMIIKTKMLHDLILKYEDESFALYNTSWLPMAIFYEAIRNGSGVFLCNPIVLNRDNPRSDNKGFWNYFYIEHIKAIEYLVTVGYPSRTVRKAMDFSTIGAIFFTVLSKNIDPTHSLLNDYVKASKIIPIHIKLLITLVDKTPKSLLKIMNIVINKFRAKN
jgi:glycosyltransferase involved in cell wall biosynthesis